jgi:hypothetical protein
MIIEGSTAIFDIATQDELTMQTYIGNFKVKCFLSPLEIIRADRIYRELIGPINSVMAGDQAQNMAFAISQLSVRIIDCPDFFKNPNSPDLFGSHMPEKVLIAVLNDSIDAETQFRGQQAKTFENTQKRLLNSYKQKKIKKQTEGTSTEDLDEDE